MVLRLIRLSRVCKWHSVLIRYFRLKNPYQYAILRYYKSSFYFDIAYNVDFKHCNVIRYQVRVNACSDLLRKTRVQNALLKYVLKHVKV